MNDSRTIRRLSGAPRSCVRLHTPEMTAKLKVAKAVSRREISMGCEPTHIKHVSGICLGWIKGLIITVAAWPREPLIVRTLSSQELAPHCTWRAAAAREGVACWVVRLFCSESMVVTRSTAADWVYRDKRLRIGATLARDCGMGWRSVSPRRIASWFDDEGCSARGPYSRLVFDPELNWCSRGRVSDRVRINKGHGGRDEDIKLLRPRCTIGVTAFGCRLNVSRSEQLGPH